MTEVPEHLLRRSRERREALGLGGGGDAPSDDAAPAAESAASETPAAAATPAPAAAAPPPEPEPAAPPPPPPPYVVAAESRSRIPVWAMPVLVLLPLWAFVYAGTLDVKAENTTGPLAIGSAAFSANCGTCHGATGGGGVGPQLTGGEVLKTFPDIDDHLTFVAEGSAKIKGQPYGDPNREGGQQVATSGGMPAWADKLSEEELRAVVLHERVTLSGEKLSQADIDAFMAGGAPSESGTPDDASGGGSGGGGGTTTTTAEGG